MPAAARPDRSRPRSAHRRPPRGPPAGEAAAEQRAQQVVQEAQVHEALGMEALAGDALVPVAVVARPPVVVGQHLVGLGDVAEALLGVRASETSGCSSRARPRKALLISPSLASRLRRGLVVVLLRHGIGFYFLVETLTLKLK